RIHSVTPLLLCSFLLMPPPPSSPFFPYTTLFRSRTSCRARCFRRLQAPFGFWTIIACAKWKAARGYWKFRNGAGCSVPPLAAGRSEEHTSELQSLTNLVCRLLLEKKKKNLTTPHL